MGFRVLTRSLNLNEFPPHGTWFVRWIDGFVRHAKSTSNPEIEIAFEQLPDDRWEKMKFAEAVARNEPPRGSKIRPRQAEIGRFHAGVITGLPIGAVIQNGAHVGELDAPIMPLTVRLPDDLFAASPYGDSFGLVHAGTTVGDLLGNGSDMALVPAEIYRTFLIPQLVTPVRIGDDLLILPSSVVIRAFISPVSAVIRDLVRRPPKSPPTKSPPTKSPPTKSPPTKPESLLHAVLGPGTGVMDTGRWRVALDPKISARHAPLLANLHEAFDAYGHLAAWRVNEGVTFLPRRLAGPVPFTGCSLQMGVHVYEIAPRHFLALDVANARWPYPKPLEIDVVRWVREGGPSDDVLFRPGGRAGLATDSPPRILTEDAHDSADVVTVRTKGPVWEALPKQQESRQTFRHEADRWVGVTSASPTTVATVGGPGPYGDAHGAVLEQQPGEPSKIERVARFEEILDLFDELCVSDPETKRGIITSWSPLAPKATTRQVWADTRPLWRFEQDPNNPNPWVVLNPGAAVERSRTALVCRLVVPGYGEATWFEIEGRRPSDVYRALIVGRLLSEPEIIAVMAAVSDQTNVRDVNYGSVLPACPTPALWKHGRVKKTGGLSADSAWGKLVAAFN